MFYPTIIVVAATVDKERSRRLSTAILNQVVRESIAFKVPPRTRGGKRERIDYYTEKHEEDEDYRSHSKTALLYHHQALFLEQKAIFQERGEIDHNPFYPITFLHHLSS